MKQIFKFSVLAAAILLLVSPINLMAQDKTIKRKVAIGRFSNETQYAKEIGRAHV